MYISMVALKVVATLMIVLAFISIKMEPNTVVGKVPQEQVTLAFTYQPKPSFTCNGTTDYIDFRGIEDCSGSMSGIVAGGFKISD